MQVWYRAILAQAVVLAACGPRLVGVGGDDESTSSAETTGESSSTSDTSTSDTSTSATTDPVFVAPKDVFDDCDSFAQDCPEGEKCVPYSAHGGSWDDNKCVPVMGEQASGEPCRYGGIVEATDDCDATSMCWDVIDTDGELIGTCRAFCMGTPDDPSCPVGSQCLVSGDSTISLCISSCDPIIQDCGDGLACYWTNDDFVCVFTMQDLPTGAPCEFINDCALGNYCVDASVLPDCMGAACCTNFCSLELGPGQCDALPGTECVPFWEQDMAWPGYEHVGVCLLP